MNTKTIQGYKIRYNQTYNAYSIKKGNILTTARTNGSDITWDFSFEIDLPNKVLNWIKEHHKAI